MQFCHSDHDCVAGYIEYLTNSAIKTNTLRRKIASLKVFYSYSEITPDGLLEQHKQLNLKFHALVVLTLKQEFWKLIVTL